MKEENIRHDSGRQAMDTLNHSASHIMASAIQELFPDVKFAIGPAIKDGFYYDFDIDKTISPEDLKIIEEKMKQIIKQDLKFEKRIVTREEAKKIFSENPYKSELIDEIKDPEVSIYTTGDFVDLCAGPHVVSTKEVRAFKLLSIAGAYWRGDERNKMLTRVYGTAFDSKEELKKHLEKLDRAKRSDHRLIGKNLDLFTFHDEAPGFPFFHPKGMVLQNAILEYWREEHIKEGYNEIRTPVILCNELWKTSGHWDNYKDNMYFVQIDECDYAIKPMNCPGAIIVYKSNQHSYREFPIRYAEMGLVHRHEKSGVLHGLFRVRNFTQDDAHIFCLEDQLQEELSQIMNMTDRMYRVFGFDNYHVELSTRPLKRIGSDKLWDKSENILKETIDSQGLDYKINEGEGAFYGPKIDYHIRDCLDRTWQCATIQLDFSMPEKFALEYTGEDNQRHRPVMIHRVILGSLERFIGILIEHYSGNLPPWLSPVQLVILPISQKFSSYSKAVFEKLRNSGYRIELDDRVESLSKKIKLAEIQKIPYMVIIGEKEEKSGTITVRKKTGEDIKNIKLEDFIVSMKKTIGNKSNKP